MRLLPRLSSVPRTSAAVGAVLPASRVFRTSTALFEIEIPPPPAGLITEAEFAVTVDPVRLRVAEAKTLIPPPLDWPVRPALARFRLTVELLMIAVAP